MMKKIILLLLFIPIFNHAMLSQMEMGQPHPELQERSTWDACCDCAFSPKFYAIAIITNKTFEYLLDKAWDNLQEHNQTALQPTVYAGTIALNAATIAGTAWYCFRQSKFKLKDD